jgi:anti-anti-sigma regulatory factor
MRSEALDIIIESRGNAVWLLLSGPFHNEQVPNIREKITGLVTDGNRHLVLDMEQTVEVGDQVVPMFLGVMSIIRGKGGDLKLVFKNEAVSKAFASHRNVFRIYPNAAAAQRGGFFDILRYRREVMSKKTGIRLSRPVAVFMIVVLCGWFLSLAIIIRLQSGRIKDQEKEIHELSQWNKQAEMELVELKDRLKPMVQLGLLKDIPLSPPKTSAGIPQKKQIVPDKTDSSPSQKPVDTAVSVSHDTGTSHKDTTHAAIPDTGTARK